MSATESGAGEREESVADALCHARHGRANACHVCRKHVAEIRAAKTVAGGCGCESLCSMGPTCPGGMLAGIVGSGCWRSEDDPTHGGNHAPLPEGVRLDPGFCDGCDNEPASTDASGALSEAEQETIRALRREIGPLTERDHAWQPMVSAGEVRVLLDCIDRLAREAAAATRARAEGAAEMSDAVRLLLAKYEGRSKWVGYEQPRREAWSEIENDLRALLRDRAARIGGDA